MACACASVIAGGSPCAIAAGVSAVATSELNVRAIALLYIVAPPSCARACLEIRDSTLFRPGGGVLLHGEDEPDDARPKSQLRDAQVIPGRPAIYCNTAQVCARQCDARCAQYLLWVIRCTFGRDRLSTNVRFASIPTVNSGLWDLSRSAMCGRLRVGKENLHGASLVGAAMCSAC